MSAGDPRDGLGRGWIECAFFVLGVATDAPRADIERTSQRLLAELAAGRPSAGTYDSPLGPRTRTPELVRSSVAALRDPQQRLRHELWARTASGATPISTDPPAWIEAFDRFGLGLRGPR